MVSPQIASCDHGSRAEYMGGATGGDVVRWRGEAVLRPPSLGAAQPLGAQLEAMAPAALARAIPSDSCARKEGGRCGLEARIALLATTAGALESAWVK